MILNKQTIWSSNCWAFIFLIGLVFQATAQERARWNLQPSQLSPDSFSDSIITQIENADKLGVQRLEIVFTGEIHLAPLSIKPTTYLKSLHFSGAKNSKLFLHAGKHQTAFFGCKGLHSLTFENLDITSNANKAIFLQLAAAEHLVMRQLIINNKNLINESQLFDLESIGTIICDQSKFTNIFDLGSIRDVSKNLVIKTNQWDNFSRGLSISKAQMLEIEGNKMHSNDGFGIHCKEILSGSLKGNQINTYQTAVQVNGVESQGSITVINNMFSSSSMAAVLFSGLSELQYFHNSSRGVYGFLANQIQNASIVNNIFYGGQSLAFRFFQMPVSLMVDHNLYFSEGPNLARIADNIWPELIGWQASMPYINQNSLEGNPLFFSNTDLHVMGLLPKSNGANNLGIFVDFDGDVRPIPINSPVDIGADEYELPVIDGMLESIFVKPVVCGDSTIQLGMIVTNLGTVPIGPTLGMQLDLRGTLTDSFRFTTNLVILPGITDTLFFHLPSIKSGGILLTNAELFVIGDQRPFNNRIYQQTLELMPLIPSVPDSVVVCSTASYAEIYAYKNLQSPHIWFESASASIPLALGDTLHVAINSATTNRNYFVNVLQESASLRTTFLGVNQVNRARFKLMAKQNLVVQGFNFSPSGTGPIQLHISVNHPGQNQWDTIFSRTISVTYDQIFNVNIDALILIPAGEELNFSIDLPPNSPVKLLGMPSLIQNFENVQMRLDAASIVENGSNGISLSGFVNSSINYLAESCLQNRKPVALKIQTETAHARLSALQDSSGYMKFDATGSFGHQYFWDFGDGSIGFGSPVWHRYLMKGDYPVKLVVVDTICHTTDTIFQTVAVSSSIGLQSWGPLERPPFPNPTSGLVEVNYPKGSKISLLQVGGVVLLEQAVIFDDPLTFDLSDYSKGFYLIKVTHPEWGATYHKIILQ